MAGRIWESLSTCECVFLTLIHGHTQNTITLRVMLFFHCKSNYASSHPAAAAAAAADQQTSEPTDAY